MNENTGTGTSGGRLLDVGLDLPGMEPLLAAGHVEPPSDQVVSRALAAVRAAAEREVGGAGALVAAAAPHRSRRRVITGGAVLAGVAAAAILPAVSIGGGKPSATAQAADFLNSMADRASGPAQGGAPYWKVSTLVGGDQRPTLWNNYYSRTTFTVEAYTGVPGKPWTRKTGKAAPGKSTLWFGDGSNAVYWDDLATLPTDPAALAKRLQGHYGARSTFVCAGDLLGTAPLSPQLRRALFQVLARIPGVRLAGTVHDAKGRIGTGLTFTQGPKSETDTLIIDPATGKLLEQEYKSSASDTRETIVSAGPVDRIG